MISHVKVAKQLLILFGYNCEWKPMLYQNLKCVLFLHKDVKRRSKKVFTNCESFRSINWNSSLCFNFCHCFFFNFQTFQTSNPAVKLSWWFQKFIEFLPCSKFRSKHKYILFFPPKSRLKVQVLEVDSLFWPFSKRNIVILKGQSNNTTFDILLIKRCKYKYRKE